MASENRDWGYDRIAGALSNLGYVISDQTVGNVLRRYGLPPAPERKRTTPWSVFIQTIMAAVATPPDESAILLLGDGEQRSRKCLVATTAHSNVIRFGRPVPRNASHPFEVEGEC